LIIWIPVVSFQSGYAQIQRTDDSISGSIINQKLQDKQENKESPNLTPLPKISSQEGSYSALKGISKQNETDNHSRNVESHMTLVDSTNFTGPADYTILVYMIGSDLELKQYSATEDIREMLTVGSTMDINIIIETGGSKSSVTDDKRFIDFTTVQRHKILKNQHQTLEDLGNQNMATSNTLSDFLIWGVSEFPAKKYVVILWDHGSGITGFGKDTNFKGDILEPAELAKAFEDSKDSTQTNFDIIGFDACLMASIEIANTVKSFGNYMVASQGLVSPAGWDYSAFLASIVKNPNQDGLMLGKKIADSFNEYYRTHAHELGYDEYRVTTISIMDLQKITDLVNSLNDLAEYLYDSLSDVNSSKGFARLIDLTDSYGKSSTGQSIFVDIHDLASNIMKISPQSSNIIGNIYKMLENTVVYKANGESRPNANGLSIYLPNTYRSVLSQSIVNSLDTWQQVMNKQYYFLQLDKRQPIVNSQTIGKNIIGWVDSSDVANVTLSVGQYSSDEFAYYTEELEPSKIINKNGYFRYFWDGEMISLCNNDRCSPTEMSLDSTGDNKFVHFPIIANTPDQLIVGLNLLYDVNDSEDIKFLGAIPSTSINSTISKERYNLPLNSSIYTPPAFASSDMQYKANLLGQSYDPQFDKSAVSATMSLTIDEIISSYTTYKEKGFLPIPSNSGNFTQLPGAINVTDQFGPKYKKYGNESYTVHLIFCDYSNNCHRSSSLLDAEPHDNNNLSINEDNFSVSGSAEITDFESYQNTYAGIKINYPKKWGDGIKFGKINNVIEEIVSYKSPSEAFSVIKDPRNNLYTISPEQYITRSLSEWSRLHPDFTLVDSRPTILSGKIAHKIVINYTEGQNRFIHTQVVSNNGPNTYLINYVSLEQDYSHNISTILRMIRSFEFIDESIIVKNPVFLTYEDPASGITMQYKSDWERLENSGILPIYPTVSFVSPPENDQDRYLEKINFHIQSLPSSFSPQDTHKYVDILVRSSLSSSQEVDNIISPLFNGSDNDWYFLAYHAKIRNTGVLVEEIWKIIDGKLYRIELLCELEKCIQYIPIYNRMISSLRIYPSDSSRWDFLTYEDPSSQIRIQYPFDWKSVFYNTNQLKEGGNIVEFWPLINNTDPSGFSDARVAIGTNESKNSISIDKIVNSLIKTYRKQFANFHLVNMENSTSLSGLPAFKLIFTLSSQNTSMRGMVTGAVLDDTLYKFSFVSPSEKFDAYLPKVTYMMESFKIGLEL
jgi:hypothetical protein